MPSSESTVQRKRVAVALAVAMAALLVVLLLVVDSGRDSPDSTGRVGAPSVSTTSTAATPAASQPPTGKNVAAGRVRTPTAEQPLRLWVGGDSLAAGPSAAVFVATHATGVIKTFAEYQVGTGLVRDEYWDWHKHLDGVIRARDPEVVIFMVGANDDQPLAVDGTSYRLPEPQWLDEYRKRVSRVMDLLTREGRHAIWIGMPPMQDPEYSGAIEVIDRIYFEEAVHHPRVAYVDAFARFSGPEGLGTYAQQLPGTEGELTDVRLDDGIHLNNTGSRLLALTVMEKLATLVTLPTPTP